MKTKKVDVFLSVDAVVTIEPEDVGKTFRFSPHLIPHSLGCGTVIDVRIQEEVEQLEPKKSWTKEDVS